MTTWTCPACGGDFPAALEYLHPRVCRAPQTQPEPVPAPAVEPDWYLEQVKVRDDAVDAIRAELVNVKARVQAAVAARDKAERGAKVEQSRRETVERKMADATRRLELAEHDARKLKTRIVELEKRVTDFQRRQRNGNHAFPLPDEEQAKLRELRQLMQPGPGV